jgi:hypothetical protein
VVQLLVEEIRRGFHDVEERFTLPGRSLILTPFSGGPVIVVGQHNLITLGEPVDCFAKRQVLMPHHEGQHIAPTPTSKAMVELIARIHMKGRSFLLVEGAQPHVAISHPTQGDHPANNIQDIDGLLNQFGSFRCAHRLTSAPLNRQPQCPGTVKKQNR